MIIKQDIVGIKNFKPRYGKYLLSIEKSKDSFLIVTKNKNSTITVYRNSFETAKPFKTFDEIIDFWKNL